MVQTKSLMPIIIAVSMVSAIGGLVFNTMPIVKKSADDLFLLNEIQVGNLSSAAAAGYLLGTVTAPLWVDRVNWKLTAMLVSVLAAITFFLASFAGSSTVLIAFAAFGLACAFPIAIATRALADMPDLERAYGTRLAVELWSIALFLYVLRVYFVGEGGYVGGMLGIMGFVILLGMGSLLFPKRGAISAVKEKTTYPSFSKAGKAWMLAIIFLVYLTVNVIVFFFLEYIAAAFTPTDSQMGRLFMGLKILGGASGAAGAIIGAKMGYRPPHIIAFAILMTGLAGMALTSNFTIFMVSTWLWEVGFTLGCLYLTTAITRFDPSRKIVVLVPALFGLSMIFAGQIGGRLFKDGNADPIYWVAAIGTIVALLSILLSKGPAPETYEVKT